MKLSNDLCLASTVLTEGGPLASQRNAPQQRSCIYDDWRFCLGPQGDSYFGDSTTVTIACERVAVRGTLSGPAFEIHSTTDGSPPSASSAPYKASLNLTATTTVRTAAFRDGEPCPSHQTEL